MSSSFVTQCPECRTRFRVNHAQLGAANGAVRCGACMHVFNAARHLVADQPVVRTAPTGESPQQAAASTPAPITPAPPVPKPPAAAAAQGTPAGKTPSDTLWIHDDLDLDDIDLDEELARLEREEMQFSKDFLDLEQAPKPAEALLTAPSESDPHDERWAEALLNENSSAEESMPAPASTAPELPRSDDQPDVAQNTPPAPSSEPPQAAPESPVDEPAQPSEQPGRTVGNRSRRRSDTAVTAADSFELIDEPVQLDWRPPARPRGRVALWGLLNLLALTLLAGQFVFRNFDDLARQDQYRPWFAQACPLLGCSLPSKVDIQQIKSSNLMVRAHPEFAGALIVDAIIYNRAPFAQPFPLLEMRFADLQGQPIASRRFKPSEYLAGELAGKTEMPSQTPIRIALEILDPGRHAENYSLNFLSPE